MIRQPLYPGQFDYIDIVLVFNKSPRWYIAIPGDTLTAKDDRAILPSPAQCLRTVRIASPAEGSHLGIQIFKEGLYGRWQECRDQQVPRIDHGTFLIQEMIPRGVSGNHGQRCLADSGAERVNHSTSSFN